MIFLSALRAAEGRQHHSWPGPAVVAGRTPAPCRTRQRIGSAARKGFEILPEEDQPVVVPEHEPPRQPEDMPT
jgi:hypothetical protein